MKANLITYCLKLVFLAFLFYQCSDPHERYEDPPWLGGTNIETLEKEGNYTHFLALMDRAEYRVSIENQLFTLFVPNDSAFEAYFASQGINSVEDMSVEAAEELFGQHILINPRSREQLMYEYAWSELQDPKGEYGTLFLRKLTYSVPLDYSEVVRYDEEYQGQTLKIYRDRTMIPLFTTEYFEDYFGDPEGSDYLFMYPGSSWSGTQWHDAMVTEAEVRTSSGFIYYIDRVVAPIPTIEKYLLEHQEDFGLYYDIAQRFASYYNPEVNEQNERRYHKGYNQILDFANEWGPSGDLSPSNPDMYPEMLYMFSTFIPYDHVLQEFLDNTVLQYYETIDEIPQLFLVYLLQSHLNSFLNLPSKMEQRFKNYYGDDIAIDINNDIANAYMCSNGIIYMMNRILEPNAFSCVPGPIFYNKDYTTFLYALNNSGLLSTLTQPGINVTLFAADNDQLLERGIRQNIADEIVVIEVMSSDGLWHTMEPDHLENFVNDYIHVGLYEDFQGEGFIRMESDNYLYYNTGRVASGGNQVAGDDCLVTEKVPSEKNGNLFYLDNAILEPKNAAEFILEDPELTSFGDLLSKAGLIDSVQADYELTGVLYPRVIFMSQQKQWTIMAPTNQAIADAEVQGIIPEDVEELKDFIYYHFVRGKCVFDDGQLSGSLPTHLIDTVIVSEIIYEPLIFNNSIYDLSVEDKSGQTAAVDHADANNLIEQGVVHRINTVLRIDQ
jgi:uncharacterized surface protein with fasciclin (FAS1) repeats